MYFLPRARGRRTENCHPASRSPEAKRLECETVSTGGSEIASGVAAGLCATRFRKVRGAFVPAQSTIAEILSRERPKASIEIEKSHPQWFTRVTHSGPVCRARTGKRYVTLIP